MLLTCKVNRGSNNIKIANLNSNDYEDSCFNTCITVPKKNSSAVNIKIDNHMRVNLRKKNS